LLFCKFTLHVSGVNHTLSSGVHKTVTTAFGTGHIFCAASSLQRGQASSGVHKTLTTASGTCHNFVQLPPSYVTKLAWPSFIRSTQICNYSLRYWLYFLCSYLPPTWPSSSGVYKTLTTASGTGHNFCAATFLQRGQASSGVHKTLTTASGTSHIFVQLPPSYVTKLAWPSFIRSTQNCNYSLCYWLYFLCSYLPPTWPIWPRWREVAAQKI